MKIDDKAFEAFMLAYHEYGGTGLGFRKCLEAYEAAKPPVSLHELWRIYSTATGIGLPWGAQEMNEKRGIRAILEAAGMAFVDDTEEA